ncbi:AIPR family protein [Bacillus cereus group sp. MYBK185-1]|uniref:AIPR family protein n=1 Tax=Bacillus cereus group sp. MYBK185-1 TaxID=3450672 RepID=UPI003F79A417
MTQKIKIPVSSLRTIPCPHGRDKGDNPQKTYIAMCNVHDLPNDIPMKTNPREQNTKTNVAKKIKESLLTDFDLNFHLLNRGILLSAESVKFNNESGELTIFFSDGEKHGNVDGGHTYTIIKENRKNLQLDQYVRLEILTGVEDFFEQLAGARNTSVQVLDKSLAELEKKFDLIKKGLAGTSYIDKVAFKENAEGEIDVYEIVALLTMFNLDRFSANSQPVITYSSKKKCTDYYLKDIEIKNNAFEKMIDIMPSIFKLHDYIEKNIAKKYKEKTEKGRYGAVKGVTYKEGSEFTLRYTKGESTPHMSPKGFIYPILAAFRSLVGENDGKYVWKADPFKYFDDLGGEMVRDTVERSRTLGNNPQSVGKDAGHWSQLYKTVSNQYLEEMVKQLTAQNA